MQPDNILGHEKPIKIINSYIENSSFCGAYIFSGPESIGKRLTAQFIAQELLGRLGHPDLHIIDKAQAQIKIEDIRDIQRQAFLRPYEGKVKIFIIDNAHKLNPDAQNCLLKVLEEPPAYVSIILITHKPQSIAKTVLSRCKTIKFSPLPRELLENILIKNYFLDKTSAKFLGFYAEGRIGVALKLKDAPLLFEKNKIFDSFVISQKPHEYNIMGRNKEELHISLNILASWFRDIYLLKAGVSQKEAIHSDRLNDLLKQVPRFSFRQLDEIIQTISESLLYLDKNINTKLILHNLWLWLKEAKPLPCG